MFTNTYHNINLGAILSCTCAHFPARIWNSLIMDVWGSHHNSSNRSINCIFLVNKQLVESSICETNIRLLC